MSTSESRKVSRVLNAYLIAFAFCSVFSIVYEIFAKGIISFWMLGMPLFPFFLGTVPALIFEKTNSSISDWALQFWNCGVITLTVGSLLNGIFDIFGTYFDMFGIFMISGTLLIISGAAVHIVKCKTK